MKPADTAARLAPDDPTVQYDAGTVHLGAGDARKAVSLLEKAAKGAEPRLSPAAQYNLGNARLATGDASGAVEAFKQALREQPANQDAKHNLELALREAQKQRSGGQGNPSSSRGQQKQSQQPSNQQGQGTPRQDQQKREASPPAPSRASSRRRGSPRSRAKGRTTACRSSATSRT